MFSHLLKMPVLVEEDERETFGGNLVIDVTFLRGFQRAPPRISRQHPFYLLLSDFQTSKVRAPACDFRWHQEGFGALELSVST